MIDIDALIEAIEYMAVPWSVPREVNENNPYACLNDRGDYKPYWEYDEDKMFKDIAYLCMRFKPMKPAFVTDGQSLKEFQCGNCNCFLDSKAEPKWDYCPFCGCEIKWENNT